MFVNNLSLSVILTTFAVINYVHGNTPYWVPEPKIEVFKKGFRFSIPHDEGIDLFAFHGNINVPMEGLEAGQFSRDILKKCGDFWVFEDTSEELEVGDKIYFWLFVIRNRLGYRYNNEEYVVREITEFMPLTCESALIRSIKYSKPIAATKIDKKEEKLSLCCDLFLNISYNIVDVSQQNDRLIEENSILSEIAGKDEYYSKTLRLFGTYPTKYYPTPKHFAENLILEKLLLNDVKVIEAKVIPENGISFKVEKLTDKVKIILAAKKGLKGSNFELSW